ncbi:MAG TPA: methyltransferase domain-containing protein [Gaiellaceae bacterium]
MVEVTRERRIVWRQRLPREGPVDRHEALVEAARGRRTVHVGFVDELMTSKIAAGVWLHARLAGAAATLVGLDADEQGVAAARADGYEAHVVDVQSVEAVRALGLGSADVVVAGELIEHLDAPGPFLRAMREVADELVLTTPNAYRLLNFLAPLTGSELVHPDHTAWHSPATVRRLCEDSGWQVTRIAYYYNPMRRRVSGGMRARLTGQLANVTRIALRRVNGVVPYWSDGFVVWARRS